MKIESGRQRHPLNLLIHLGEGEGKPDLNSCVPCNGLCTDPGIWEKEKNQAWIGESCGMDVGALGGGRRKRIDLGCSAPLEEDPNWILVLICNGFREAVSGTSIN